MREISVRHETTLIVIELSIELSQIKVIIIGESDLDPSLGEVVLILEVGTRVKLDEQVVVNIDGLDSLMCNESRNRDRGEEVKPHYFSVLISIITNPSQFAKQITNHGVLGVGCGVRGAGRGVRGAGRGVCGA